MTDRSERSERFERYVSWPELSQAVNSLRVEVKEDIEHLREHIHKTEALANAAEMRSVRAIDLIENQMERRNKTTRPYKEGIFWGALAGVLAELSGVLDALAKVIH